MPPAVYSIVGALTRVLTMKKRRRRIGAGKNNKEKEGVTLG